jgi:omega-6 fatty acid desaturase (delta-12 desaturase)
MTTAILTTTGTANAAAAPVRSSPRDWNSLLARYREPSLTRSLVQLLTTTAIFVALWWLMLWSIDISYWITLPIAIVEGGVTVRLFMFLHDCVHGSFFRSETANSLLGSVIGVLTFTPFRYWRRNHVLHHATVGNLDKRGYGDIHTLTVKEYLAQSWLGRLGYRFVRHPAVYLLLGPVYIFLLKHRLPIGMPLSWKKEWISILWNDVALVAVVVLMWQTVGFTPFIKIQAPVFIVSTIAGIWLFHVQHQFDTVSWQRDESWDHVAMSMQGSSYLDLPEPLRWSTANIGLHHIHHLCSAIPNYRLLQCQREVKEIPPVRRLTLWQSFRCARLAVWDEEAGRLLKFSEVRKR